MVLWESLANVSNSLVRVLQAIRDAKPRGPVQPLRARQRQKRLPELEQQRVVDEYCAGIGTVELAHRFGCSRQTINAILKRAGIELRPAATDPAVLARAAELYEQGLSLEAVGVRLGISARTVLSQLRRQGIPVRPVGTNQWR